ncbi:PQ loop repeat-domain-containing protein [Absidia repens]|uniref:PQ loop repeat-domain-containing protein n=1 Tax=Absidia repens TaxID=90262 RepID=A0A1X2INH5_9FUNG|nr:PQ loop repeat-domain-containing protein [Absidia repens]
MSQCLPTKDGIPFSPWIRFVFGDCTYGYLDGASVLLGYLSILFWLNAQFPQVIVNYRRSSADGLSITFLVIWLAGDAANLIGCILTNQLAFQRYLGIYFVSVDVCLVLQYFYYGKLQQRKARPPNINNNYYRKTHEDTFLAAFQHPSAQTPLLVQNGSIDGEDILPYSVSVSPNKWYTLAQHPHGGLDKTPSTTSLSSSSSSSSSSSTSATTSVSPTKGKTATTGLMTIMFLGFQGVTSTSSTSLLSSSPSLDMPSSVVIGTFFAWSCTTFYLSSRVPQIRKNFKRRSVQGLSPSLFIFAVCGNLAYTSSILLHPGQTRDTLLDALPYLLGSAGTLVFDLTIFLQFLYYSRLKHSRHGHSSSSPDRSV